MFGQIPHLAQAPVHVQHFALRVLHQYAVHGRIEDAADGGLAALLFAGQRQQGLLALAQIARQRLGIGLRRARPLAATRQLEGQRGQQYAEQHTRQRQPRGFALAGSIAVRCPDLQGPDPAADAELLLTDTVAQQVFGLAVIHAVGRRGATAIVDFHIQPAGTRSAQTGHQIIHPERRVHPARQGGTALRQRGGGQAMPVQRQHHQESGLYRRLLFQLLHQPDARRQRRKTAIARQFQRCAA